MILAYVLTVVFAVLSGIGFLGIQVKGNYENIWGYMFWWGLILFALTVIITLALLIISAFLSTGIL